MDFGGPWSLVLGTAAGPPSTSVVLSCLDALNRFEQFESISGGLSLALGAVAGLGSAYAALHSFCFVNVSNKSDIGGQFVAGDELRYCSAEPYAVPAVHMNSEGRG